MILRPLLFNIFLADLFFISNNVDIAHYADGNSPYADGGNVIGVITSLGKSSKALFEWFKNNPLKSNADKCYQLVSSGENTSIREDEYETITCQI